VSSTDDADPALKPEAVSAAMAVLDAHMAALNARDTAALAATLHFPHYRLSPRGMKVWETPATYLVDFLARAGDGWAASAWEFRRPVAATAEKVHLDVQFARRDAAGTVMRRFRSLWVVTEAGGRWAVALRSTFAP
jgi:hypothetical protein